VNILTEEDIRPEVLEHLYGLFRSKTKAVDALRGIVRENGLCPRAVGLENGKGACFAHQLKRCNGVCAGCEAPELHYLRLKQALIPLKIQSWPYPGRIGIREYNASSGRSEVHVFDYWCHLGTVDNEADLNDVIRARSSVKFDLDAYRLLLKNLGKQAGVSLGVSFRAGQVSPNTIQFCLKGAQLLHALLRVLLSAAKDSTSTSWG
jgi:DNA polymerase-3 subunit epsilon